MGSVADLSYENSGAKNAEESNGDSRKLAIGDHGKLARSVVLMQFAGTIHRT